MREQPITDAQVMTATAQFDVALARFADNAPHVQQVMPQIAAQLDCVLDVVGEDQEALASLETIWACIDEIIQITSQQEAALHRGKDAVQVLEIQRNQLLKEMETLVKAMTTQDMGNPHVAAMIEVITEEVEDELNDFYATHAYDHAVEKIRQDLNADFEALGATPEAADKLSGMLIYTPEDFTAEQRALLKQLALSMNVGDA